MLFCPGPSAILVFWTALYRPLILSATPERHPRNKKPYCSTLRNTVISVDRQSSKPLLLGTPGFSARTYTHTHRHTYTFVVELNCTTFRGGGRRRRRERGRGLEETNDGWDGGRRLLLERDSSGEEERTKVKRRTRVICWELKRSRNESC